MGAGPLSARVAALCDETAPRLGPAARATVLDVRRRLDEPLRVAIAGRLKAGKSTLVNAMVGRRVAPTDVGECTRVVTQFRYGTADRVELASADLADLSAGPADLGFAEDYHHGHPWADPAVLGHEALPPLDDAAGGPDPAELFAYAGERPPADRAGWPALIASADPATSALARWWSAPD